MVSLLRVAGHKVYEKLSKAMIAASDLGIEGLTLVIFQIENNCSNDEVNLM